MSTPPSTPIRRAATKQCEVCQATFTRKTHLNRHMRSHTNDRSHKCKLCNSQFTRSDLLTRHKKICGGFRSRRKSCQACAKAKSRCDLQTPSCSKCISRGIECEYVTGPAARKVPDSASPAPGIPNCTIFPFPPSNTKSPFDFDADIIRRPSSSSDSSSSLFGTDCDSSSVCSSPADMWPTAAGLPDFAGQDPSLTNIMDTSALFDIPFTNMHLNSECAAGIDGLSASEWDSLYEELSTCGEYYKPGWPVEVASCPPPHIPQSSYPFSDKTWHSGVLPQMNVPPLTAAQLPFLQCTPLANPDTVRTIPTSTRSPHSHEPRSPKVDNSLLDNFQHLFLTDFLTQLPILHIPSWNANDKPDVLIKAMQACGALYARTIESEKFITEVLKSGREEIIMDFVRQTDPMQQTYLILALVLIQSIGLFHQSAEQRRSSAIYHAIIAPMVNRSPAFQELLRWSFPVDFLFSSSLDDIWQEWVRFETAKRVLSVFYLHDCCQAIFFATPPTGCLSANLCLPCEPALWNARTSQEWYACLQQPSRYGSPASRLKGLDLQQAWSSLVEQRPPAVTTYTSAFGHFILVHCALAQIFIRVDSGTDNGAGLPVCFTKTGSEIDTPLAIHTMRNALHNWLLNWQYEALQCHGPESPTKLVFAEDALPFYWLCQISLFTFCEGKGRGPTVNPDVRFQLVKEWLDRIRECLGTQQAAPAQCISSLMKLRPQYTTVNVVNPPIDRPDGLLELFPTLLS
ncbi:hypothetical protein E1B28_000737 [Marasmius oreades]|uniref:Uncharacterized protein n=1 Tax=Marasmius oreades TaxID=181124 RepID=A0A9P8AET2_9AGAR|nr:uncharacterized protein E1B28_000737 [Marasmius oreades]KAG7098833.1 hypothetical protein E1B28_000737 [Marasmius oreades]